MHREWLCSLTALRVCAAIVVPHPSMTMLESRNAAIVESQEEPSVGKGSISCLKKIASSDFPRKQMVPVLIPRFFDDPPLSRALLIALQSEAAIYTVSEDFRNEDIYESARSAVIMLRNSTDVELMNDMNDLCGPRCRLVFFLAQPRRTRLKFLEEVERIAKALWKVWIANLVVLGEAGDAFLVAGTHEFQSDEYLEPKTPVILADCRDLEDRSAERPVIFQAPSPNRCVLNVTAFNCPPYVFHRGEFQLPLTGIEGDLFEAVAAKINFSLNRIEIKEVDNDSDVYNTLITTLDSKDDTDVVFCGLYQGLKDTVEYSVAYDVRRVTWYVPSRNMISLFGLVAPFEYPVWAGVLGIFVFAGIVRVFVFRELSLLSVFAIVFGVALPRQPTRLSRRIHFISWVIYGYVVTQYYLASLAGQLMNANYQAIKTMEELESSGLSLGGTERLKELFKDADNAPVVRSIYEKYQTLSATEYEDVLEKMERAVNNSIALVIEVKTSGSAARPESSHPQTLDETLARYPLAMAVWKGFPFLDQVNRRISQLTEAGFVKYWSQVHAASTNHVHEITRPKPFDLLHLSPSFILLLIGQAISIVVFVMELAMYSHNHNLYRLRRTRARKYE